MFARYNEFLIKNLEFVIIHLGGKMDDLYKCTCSTIDGTARCYIHNPMLFTSWQDPNVVSFEQWIQQQFSSYRIPKGRSAVFPDFSYNEMKLAWDAGRNSK